MTPTRTLQRIVLVTAITALACTLAACSGDAGASHSKAPATLEVAGVTVTTDSALHAALPDAIKKSGTVRVATDVPYAPFEMFVKQGGSDLTGLDYDLGQALGTRLGVTFAFTPQKFDGIVPAIQAGKFDAAMSAITDNKERQQVVDFVDYSQSGSGILVSSGNPEEITGLADLCGKKVAVQAATNQLKLLKAHQSECAKAGAQPMSIQSFPKDSDAQLALRAGKVAADVLTQPAAGWTAKTADGGRAFVLVVDPKAPGGYNASPNGIAVSRKLPELTSAVQKALQSLINDGTLKKICAKYGVASIAAASATKNAAVD
ncbi:ABC transporter substrate-binding protein [Streptomyces sp. NPDC059819]|uniref:ABC transporter substrate-binding protein n=1 Tax=Streptomyces sp. NPDC059819 TaxID=3346963 RepID=UPI003656A640